jgi:lysyl-tRNA synthetase class II
VRALTARRRRPLYPLPIPPHQAQELREAGQEPYAYRFDRTHYTDDLQRQYEGLTAGEARGVARRGAARRAGGEGRRDRAPGPPRGGTRGSGARGGRRLTRPGPAPPQPMPSTPPGEEDASADVAVAGRIVARRVMGKLAFLSVRDDRGTVQVRRRRRRGRGRAGPGLGGAAAAGGERRTTADAWQSATPQPSAHPNTFNPLSPPHPQLYVDKARLEEAQPGAFAQLKNQLDVGDIVGAAGSVKRTEKGELSVVARSLEVCVLGFAGGAPGQAAWGSCRGWWVAAPTSVSALPAAPPLPTPLSPPSARPSSQRS